MLIVGQGWGGSVGGQGSRLEVSVRGKQLEGEAGEGVGWPVLQKGVGGGESEDVWPEQKVGWREKKRQ